MLTRQPIDERIKSGEKEEDIGARKKETIY